MKIEPQRPRRRAKPASDLPPVKVRKGEIAHQRILEALFDRRIPTGAVLSQGDLVRLLGVPIQPLRDALRVLEAEGILVINPRSGIQFLKADTELARSTYQFRSVIERAAARAFAEGGSLAEIQRLKKSHIQLQEQLEADGPTPKNLIVMEELEQDFHGTIIGILRNPLIENSARRLKNYVALIRMDRHVTLPLLERTLREHVDVLDACELRDGDAAEAALSRHFQAALQRVLGMV